MRLRVRSLPLLSGLGIRRCRELGCRSQTGSDPAWLWLWRRPVATAPIQPLAWEPPYAAEAAQEIATATTKKTKDKKKGKKTTLGEFLSWRSGQRIRLGTMRWRVRSLPLLSGLTIRRCRELWCRLQTGSDPALLWLWHSPMATAPIQPLAWEPPYAMGAAQEIATITTTTTKKTKDKKKKKKKRKTIGRK